MDIVENQTNEKDSFVNLKNEDRIRARVTKVQRELYTIECEHGETTAKLKGNFYQDKELLDYPVVGDYVMIRYNPYGNSIIEQIEPRKSVFSRTDFCGHAVGYAKTIKEQVIAANFDYVFIMAALNKDYNINRITRYISAALQSNAKPVVVLTKADLCEDVEARIQEVKNISDRIDVLAISAINGIGLEQLTPYFSEDKTIVFLGSSGVGKSTLVNAVAGTEIMKVSGIREDDSKGRHTTTYRQLIKLDSGVTVIDTPGMRELGMWYVEDGINDTFSDIAQLMGTCKFHNCSHTTEPGCAIKMAIEAGTITELRWKTYCQLVNENEFGKRKSNIRMSQKKKLH